MRRVHVWQLTALVGVVAVLGSAPRTADADVVKCQRAIAKASAQFLQAHGKASAACAGSVVKNGTGTCPDDKTTAALDKAAAKLTSTIAKGCGGKDRLCNADTIDEDLPATIGWPAVCPNLGLGDCDGAITSCGDIAACLLCLGEKATATAIDLAFGDLLLPSGGDPTLNACQHAIGKATTTYLGAESKALQKCWNARLAGQHANSCEPPAVGDGKYLAAIAKADAKRTSTIAKACGGADKTLGGGDDQTPAAIGFATDCPTAMVPGGPACGGTITDLTSLVACSDCLADLSAACVDRAQVPGLAAYPTECSACFAPAETGPCPTAIALTADGPAVDLDVGFTGLGHDESLPTDSRVTLAVSGCAGTEQPTCGECTLSGPLPNAGGPSFTNQRCHDRPWESCTSDLDCVDTPCGFFFGAPQGTDVGGVPVCILNEIAGPVTGTLNLSDGSAATVLGLRTRLHATGSLDHPCPTCVAGLCVDGARNGQPCTVNGAGVLGDVSLDCPPNPGYYVGTLSFDFHLTTGLQTRSISAANPTCRQTGYTGLKCLCDTCNNLNADPCASNADCPPSGGNPGVCGGRRCIGGLNEGTPCTVTSECPGGLCNRPGEATQPNICHDDTALARDCLATGGGEGECAAGPYLQRCSRDTFRACSNDADCVPIAEGGACAECTIPNQICVTHALDCFPDNGLLGSSVTATGRPGPICDGAARPTLGALTCMSPIAASVGNAAFGLPGLGRLRLPVTITP